MLGIWLAVMPITIEGQQPQKRATFTTIRLDAVPETIASLCERHRDHPPLGTISGRRGARQGERERRTSRAVTPPVIVWSGQLLHSHGPNCRILREVSTFYNVPGNHGCGYDNGNVADALRPISATVLELGTHSVCSLCTFTEQNNLHFKLCNFTNI